MALTLSLGGGGVSKKGIFRDVTNKISRKLGVFDQKLEGRHFIFLCYFDIISEIKKR